MQIIFLLQCSRANAGGRRLTSSRLCLDDKDEKQSEHEDRDADEDVTLIKIKYLYAQRRRNVWKKRGVGKAACITAPLHH